MQTSCLPPPPSAVRTLKFGKLVGTDQFGNEYYENTKDYQHGQHRWCEYAGDKSFYQVDSSVVPPEWHLWLHHLSFFLFGRRG